MTVARSGAFPILVLRYDESIDLSFLKCSQCTLESRRGQVILIHPVPYLVENLHTFPHALRLEMGLQLRENLACRLVYRHRPGVHHHPAQTLDQVAADAGTISYEILTSLGPRYHRIYRGAAISGH